MVQYLLAACCKALTEESKSEFVIFISPESIGEFPNTEPDNTFHLEDRNGNSFTWNVWYSDTSTSLEYHADSEATKVPIVLREENRYYIELRTRYNSIAFFRQLLGSKANPYASLSAIPRQNKMWLLQTRSSAGVLPLTVENVTVLLDVRPSKLDYKSDYKDMLGDLAEKGVDFLLDPRSPIGIKLQPDGIKEDHSAYLNAVTIDALFNCRKFLDALTIVRVRPHRQSKDELGELLTGTARAIKSVDIIQGFRSPSSLTKMPTSHPLYNRFGGLIPRHVEVITHSDELATRENRFLSYILTSLNNSITELIKKLGSLQSMGSFGTIQQLLDNLHLLKERINLSLSLEPFKNSEPLAKFPVGSTVLTGRSGYREIYSTWLLWNSGIKVDVYNDSSDIYGGSKLLWKLYQSWCLLAIQDALDKGPQGEPLGVEWHSNSYLWRVHNHIDGNSYLTLVPGKSQRKGTWENIDVCLWYEKKFEYSKSTAILSSYSVDMAPDITVMIKKHSSNIIKLLHFDAKYSVKYIDSNTDEDIDFINVSALAKTDNIEKMHTYQDGLRSPLDWTQPFITEGTFVLFPGDNAVIRPMDRINTSLFVDEAGKWHPGIGAVPLRPSSNEDLSNLRNLIWNWIKSNV